MASNQNAAPAEKQVPRYRLTAKCYLDDRLYDPEMQPVDKETGEAQPLIIAYTGVPGWYMEPVNAAAREACAANPNYHLQQASPEAQKEVQPMDFIAALKDAFSRGAVPAKA